MSTLANIIALLQNWQKATRNNDSISLFFIIYQAAMLFSTVNPDEDDEEDDDDAAGTSITSPSTWSARSIP